MVILEREPVRDESHTWCLFRSDVSADFWHWLAPPLLNDGRGRDRATRQLIARMYDVGLADLDSARHPLGLAPLGWSRSPRPVAFPRRSSSNALR